MNQYLFNKIHPKYFLISLAFGFLICYLTTPTPRILIQHPNPENTETVYHKNANTCFKYDALEIKCPDDSSKIKIQTD